MAFAAWRGDDHRLFRRLLDQPEAQPLAGTERAMNPFFSPDGEWVGFWADGQLKKIALSGGPSVPLCKSGPIFGASWGTNNMIVYAELGGGLQTISADGGAPRRLTEVDSVQAGFSERLPWVLPGGDAVLFTVSHLSGSWEQADVVAQSLVTGERRVLIKGGAHPVYTSSGRNLLPADRGHHRRRGHAAGRRVLCGRGGVLCACAWVAWNVTRRFVALLLPQRALVLEFQDDGHDVQYDTWDERGVPYPSEAQWQAVWGNWEGLTSNG